MAFIKNIFKNYYLELYKIEIYDSVYRYLTDKPTIKKILYIPEEKIIIYNENNHIYFKRRILNDEYILLNRIKVTKTIYIKLIDMFNNKIIKNKENIYLLINNYLI
jgi:hypothetical protein